VVIIYLAECAWDRIKIPPHLDLLFMKLSQHEGQFN